MSRARTWYLCVLCVAGVSAIPALASRPTATAVQASERFSPKIERSREYLALKPFHDKVFEGLIEAALEENVLAALVAAYEAEQRAAPEALAPKALLARLYARQGSGERALELLAEAQGLPLSAHLWLAHLALAEGDPRAASRRLEAYKDKSGEHAAQESDNARKLHAMRSELFSILGERAAALSALRDLSALPPAGYHERMFAAGEMHRMGFKREALGEFAAAVAAAGSDAARKARAFSELGALHEELLEGSEAIAANASALDLLARGHWLEAEIWSRNVRLYRQAARLTDLVEQLQEEHAAQSADLLTIERLSAVLLELRRTDEARELLDAAAASHPADLALGRRRLAFFAAADDSDGVEAEYERLLRALPNEYGLREELGTFCARRGALSRAAHHWSLSMDGDPSAVRRIAQRWQLMGEMERARACRERALAADDADLGNYAELAGLWLQEGALEQALRILERGRESAGASARRLAEWAGHLRALGRYDDALPCLEQALALEPGVLPRLLQLADAQERAGRTAEAAAHYRELVDKSTALTRNRQNSAALRDLAAARFAMALESHAALEEAAALERKRLTADGVTPAPYLLLIAISEQLSDDARASALLAELLAAFPEEHRARVRYAQHLARLGDQRAALDQYKRLIAEHPENHGDYAKDAARLAIALGERAEIQELLEGWRRVEVADADGLMAVARAWSRTEWPGEAGEILRQALPLAQDPGSVQLELARVLVRSWEREFEPLEDEEEERPPISAAIITAWHAAHRSQNEDVRRAACVGLYDCLAGDETETLISDLQARVRMNPFDLSAARLAVALLFEDDNPSASEDAARSSLERNPSDPVLLRLHSRALFALGRGGEAATGLERLLGDSWVEQDSLLTDLVEAHLIKGNVRRVLELGAGSRDTLGLARALRKYGHLDDAAGFLKKALAMPESPALLWAELGDLELERDDEGAALLAFETYSRRGGDDAHVLTQLGGFYHSRGRAAEVIECGRRMLDLHVSHHVLKSYFESKLLRHEYSRLRVERTLRDPQNALAIRKILRSFAHQRYDAPAGTELVHALRAVVRKEGLVPAGMEAGEWLAELEVALLRFYRLRPDIARKRAAALGERAAAQEGLNADEWAEFGGLLLQVGAAQERSGDPLGAGLAAYPDLLTLLTLAAELHDSVGEAREAALIYERLQTAALPQAVSEPLPTDANLAQYRKCLDLYFRNEHGVQLSAARIAMLARATFRQADHISPGRFSLRELRRRSARCWHAAGETDRSAALLKIIEPEEGYLLETLDHARLLIQMELLDRANILIARAKRDEASVQADPQWEHLSTEREAITEAWIALTAIYEESGAWPAAYELALSVDDEWRVAGLLGNGEAFVAIEAAYRERLLQADDALALHYAGMRLGHMLQFVDRWEDAAVIYGRLARSIPDHLPSLEWLAQYAELDFDIERAVELQRRVIDIKTRLGALPKTERPAWTAAWAPAPLPISWAAASDSWVRLQGLCDRRGAFDTVRNWLGIVRAHFEGEEVEMGLDALEQLARHAPDFIEGSRGALAFLAKSYELGAGSERLKTLIQLRDQR